METNSQNTTVVLSGELRNRLSAFGGTVRDLLLYSSAYLALIAVAEVLIVTELLSLALSPAPLVAGLLTFAIYGNDRLADVETDAMTAPERAAFVIRYRRLLYALSALAYGLAVALAVLGGPVAFGLSLLPGVIWVCYAQDWLPTFGRVQRLKDVFVLNSVLVAGAWALVIVFLPIAFADAALTPAVGVVFAFFFLATFVNVEVPNVRDRAGDREIGVRTLPVVLGLSGTRYFLYGVTGLTAAILCTALYGGVLAMPAVVGLSASLLCVLAIVACLGRTDRNGALTVAAECSRLPLLALVAVPLL